MNILILIDKFDLKHVAGLKNLLHGYNGWVVSDTIYTLAELKPKMQKREIDAVICCNATVLKKLVLASTGEEGTPTLHDYKGSMFSLHDKPCLILPPCKQLYTVPYMKFLFKRWLQKLTNPNFPTFPKLDWGIADAMNLPSLYEEFKEATLIAVDIETLREEVDDEIHLSDNPTYKGMWVRAKKSATSKKMINFIPKIYECGYCGLFKREDGTFYSKAIVLPIEDMTSITWMRKFNSLPAPKVLQNGGYDCTYFLRYSAPMENYLWDTFVFMHSWYAELPRDLSFITGMFNRDSMYWKDETGPEYNAKDTHNTLWSFILMLQEAPQWAKDNYAENFRYQFPNIHCGLEGLKVDPIEQHKLREEREAKVEEAQGRLDKLITEGFNPNSPKQVLAFMKGMGYNRASSSDAKNMVKWGEAHPLYEVFANLITKLREDRKAISTYFNVTTMDGRMLYELSCAGTDTGRFASKASNLWCGTQVQNIPVYAKGMYVVDDGWEFSSIDNGQSESRCTAYISEDENLMKVVEEAEDFHRTNATLFFGLPLDGITAAIRKLGKRVNHGANYNMGWRVLWESMGTKAVLTAKRLLRLPRQFKIKQVCEHLLACFDTAYPDVRGKYYEEVIEEIQKTQRLTGATGWTRYCFGDPTASKLQLNSYVAHAPQSLSVKIINAAYFDVWLRLQIKEEKIRIKAQVHDEIFYQNKLVDRDYVAGVISERMAQPTIVRGRTMIIPNDPTLGGYRWSDLKD